MADLRISDAPELLESEVQGGLKIPTGGFGNKAINMTTVANWVVKDKNLPSKDYVDDKFNQGNQGLSGHVTNKNNPHQVTKEQVGLGNVDNTSDADKPISNAVAAALDTKVDKSQLDGFATTNALDAKADKSNTYTKSEVYTKDQVDNAVDDIYQSLEDNVVKNGATLQYDPQVVYNDGAIVNDNGTLKIFENGNLNLAVKADGVQVDDSTLDVFAANTKYQEDIVELFPKRFNANDRQKFLNLDRELDVTDYLKTALSEYSSKRTDADDTYSNARGLVRIKLPKGVYTIRPDEIKIQGAYGLIVEGDGVATTAILCKSDSGVYFDFTPYMNIKFKDMSIIHQPQSSDKSTWSNSLFKLNGYGGGRRFSFDNVFAIGFNRVIEFVSQNNANEDTTYAVDSAFSHCNTFIYSRSSQAVNNSFTRCSFYGDIRKVFDVSNYGHTHISDTGVVIAGSFISLADHAGYYGKTAQFVMTNVKFEYLKSDLTNTNSTTKIIETADSPNLQAFFKLINCGIAGGTPDPTVRTFDIKGGTFILDVQGGEWVNATISTKAQVAANSKDIGYIKFSGCAVAPSTEITRITGAAGAMHKPVIFENCANIDNIVILAQQNTGNGYAKHSAQDNYNRVTNSRGRLISSNVTETLSVLSYNQKVFVRQIELIVESSVAATNALAKLYLDSAKTTVIEEVAIAASANPQILKFNFNGVSSEGVFIEISQNNANTSIVGSVTVTTTSI